MEDWNAAKKCESISRHFEAVKDVRAQKFPRRDIFKTFTAVKN